ncbi:hypothetical protein WN51_01838 [Melipona quadrifasciata]|uniref:Uncharacterized protein n=1 Tax=Melipona quadrifasciata TaxID=166423 RepID=A0A0M8ZWN5_9HYME|nr:hypothetical protein WN51_01838 [Melipona quadrifasciata]
MSVNYQLSPKERIPSTPMPKLEELSSSQLFLFVLYPRYLKSIVRPKHPFTFYKLTSPLQSPPIHHTTSKEEDIENQMRVQLTINEPDRKAFSKISTKGYYDQEDIENYRQGTCQLTNPIKEEFLGNIRKYIRATVSMNKKELSDNCTRDAELYMRYWTDEIHKNFNFGIKRRTDVLSVEKCYNRSSISCFLVFLLQSVTTTIRFATHNPKVISFPGNEKTERLRASLYESNLQLFDSTRLTYVRWEAQNHLIKDYSVINRLFVTTRSPNKLVR